MDFQENFIKSNIVGSRGAGGRGERIIPMTDYQLPNSTNDFNFAELLIAIVTKAYYIIVFHLHRFQIPIGSFVW
jgi:hypothetical protein